MIGLSGHCFSLLWFFVIDVAMCDLVLDVETIYVICYLLTAVSRASPIHIRIICPCDSNRLFSH